MFKWLNRKRRNRIAAGIKRARKRGYLKGTAEGHADTEKLADAAIEKAVADWAAVETRRLGVAAQEAREAAYLAVLNVYNQEPGTDVPNSYREARRHIVNHTALVESIHANIYSRPQMFVVRVQIGTNRHCQQFEFGNTNEQRLKALVDALIYRNHLVGEDHVYEELFDAYYRNSNVVIHNWSLDTARNAAIGFHRHALMHDIAIDDSRFLGDDPAQRFPHADPTIFSRRRSVLQFNPRACVALACAGVTKDRTVRDVLLVSAAELREINGCGRQTLQHVRQVLTGASLALWGDTVPAVPPAAQNTGDPSQRRRGIDIT